VAADPPPDWIDGAMADGAEWVPPASFAERVVSSAAAAGALPVVHRRPSFDAAGIVLYWLTRIFDSAWGRLEGSAWAIRQYRELLWR